MQLMWISESTGRVKKIPITLKTILLAITCSALFFVVIGSLLNFIGFRIAIEKRPEMIRAVGGIITSQELEEIQNAYRDRLVQMNQELKEVAEELKELEKIKENYAEIATPKALRNTKINNKDSMGGPYKPIDLKISSENFFDSIDQSTDQSRHFKKHLITLQKQWKKQLIWLNQLPSGLPIEQPYIITSGFGVRTDPFTRRVSAHEGLDFSSSIGTLILASGPGTVIQAGYFHDYGNSVEIRHAEGYKTRYAHASEILVKPGQKVQRGEPIAKVGNTGRSTGPHLHFEVMKEGRLFIPDTKLDPNNMLVHTH